jgi:hypothetical protein
MSRYICDLEAHVVSLVTSLSRQHDQIFFWLLQQKKKIIIIVRDKVRTPDLTPPGVNSDTMSLGVLSHSLLSSKSTSKPWCLWFVLPPDSKPNPVYECVCHELLFIMSR